MNLAKPCIDIGLNTNNLEPMLAFWQAAVGLPFDHVLPIQPGMKQYRHDLLGSVLKINHFRDALPEAPACGYAELMIARDASGEPIEMHDPDGNKVTLVPRGSAGIEQIGMKLNVRDPAAHRRFFASALGLEELVQKNGASFRAGASLLVVEKNSAAPSDASFQGKGYRYLTFQVFKTDIEHAHVLANGGREAMAPRTLGTTARISMVRDPDGNWIEISQRASITGSIEA
jgi:catechol 2,3-dioxygenase-like lactoylglutathione lyase family enzyme